MPQSPLRRLFAIIKYLKSHRFASIKSISSYLEKINYPASQRSIERDFERLRKDYGVSIEYDKANGGYTMEDNSFGYLDEMCLMAEYFQSAELLQTILNKGIDKVNVIDLDSNVELLGADWLDELFKSITNERNMLITYQAFHSDKPNAHDVSPWLLKYYQGRWYVVGFAYKGLRIFGIDRIQDLAPSTTQYVKYEGNQREIFKNQIGIFISKEPPVEIRFLATPRHAQYLDTLKMHHSQKHLGKQKEWELYSLFVSINPELVQQFLFAGEKVKVLSPPDLVEDMEDAIKKMFQNYFPSDK